jgi:hypothetical protein
MKAQIDTTYHLEEEDDPMVSTHKSCVTLHLPGYMADGTGFTISFRPTHLQRILELAHQLEAITLHQTTRP